MRWLTALQAQDYAEVLTSVALRTTAGTRQGVEAALDAAEIVKSWPMRGTLHLVVAEDLPWMLRLATPRILVRAAARRAALGLDIPALERAGQLATTALADGRQMRRGDLLAMWDESGLVTAGQRGYHMLWHLAQSGMLCFGPVRDGEQLVVLVDDWIPRPRRLQREEALGEWAWRYFRSHGPATVKDFTRWTGLVAVDVRAGLALAAPRLVSVTLDGVEYFMDPQTPDLLQAYRRQARGVFLLPGFDEFILGYHDRQAALPAEFANRIVPGGNGVFRPTVVSDGHVVGTWKHTGRGAKRTVAATPLARSPIRPPRRSPRCTQPSHSCLCGASRDAPPAGRAGAAHGLQADRDELLEHIRGRHQGVAEDGEGHDEQRGPGELAASGVGHHQHYGDRQDGADQQDWHLVGIVDTPPEGVGQQ